MRWVRVIIETNCWEAAELISVGWGDDHFENNLLSEICKLLQNEWATFVEWCNREVNKVADSLAKAL